MFRPTYQPACHPGHLPIAVRVVLYDYEYVPLFIVLSVALLVILPVTLLVILPVALLVI